MQSRISLGKERLNPGNEPYISFESNYHLQPSLFTGAAFFWGPAGECLIPPAPLKRGTPTGQNRRRKKRNACRGVLIPPAPLRRGTPTGQNRRRKKRISSLIWASHPHGFALRRFACPPSKGVPAGRGIQRPASRKILTLHSFVPESTCTAPR